MQKIENRLRFDKLTESLKVGTSFETQSRKDDNYSHVLPFKAARRECFQLNIFWAFKSELQSKPMPFD